MKHAHVRLAKHVVPIKYHLTLKPDLEAFTFEGSETITINLKKSTNQITLHSKELDIESARCGQQWAKIKYNEKAETATFVFPKTLKTGKTELSLVFKGILNDKMRGFYRSKYFHQGKEKFLATTQFESTDARRSFPCFDEPHHKAVFKVELIIPEHTTAISNTVEESTGEHQSGYKVVRFSESPKMSTYLVAFIVGEFEYIHGQAKNGTIVRVHTTPGKKHQAKFALDCAVRTLDFYNKYFDIAYPLPNLDMIAIPDFAAGAMENWGAVTYRESALLVDPGHSSIQNKQWVALVVAHELAHQWFGNLVTMQWWTHLWLNEGFASYIEYLAVDSLFPKWEIWDQFAVNDLGAALKLDALQSTHPIEVVVHHPAEISEIFDAVSYSKGATIIRMLAEYVGEKDFRNGLRHYLKKHSYSNTVTEDLWQALEKTSKKPVAQIMKNWTALPGYPVLGVVDDNRSIRISQSRFFSSPISKKAHQGKPLWQIPLAIKTNKGTYRTLLTQKSAKLNKALTRASWIKLNSRETSLFRTCYTKDQLLALAGPVKNKLLPAIDRLGIIRDAFALSEAGDLPLSEVLSFAENYKNEHDYNVWVELASGLNSVEQLIFGQKYHEQYKNFVLAVLANAIKFVGFKKRKNETHIATLLRNLILAQAGRYGNALVIEQAEKLFWGKNKIDPDIRSAVYLTVAKHGGKKTYLELLRRYKKESLHEERNRLARALGFSGSLTLLDKTLEFSFSKQVRSQDAAGIFASVLVNPSGRQAAWEFLQKNWLSYLKRYGDGGHLLVRFISPLENFNTEEKAKDVGLFFKEHPAPGAERTVRQTIEQIKSNALWLKRDDATLNDFLINHKV